MRKIISVNEEDKWEKLPKEKFSDKQRRYFFAVGAMRDSKENDGYVEVNYSRIPKKKSVNEGTEPYDSSVDAYLHIENIRKVVDLMVKELSYRGAHHDESKLQEPEKSTYDKYIPELRKYKYGSKEYQQVRDAMYKEGLKHHFESNRHHPEHFKNGMSDMNIIDLMELFCDWYAASLRSDAGFEEGLKINSKKYNMPDMLISIFQNTYDEYFKED